MVRGTINATAGKSDKNSKTMLLYRPITGIILTFADGI